MGTGYILDIVARWAVPFALAAMCGWIGRQLDRMRSERREERERREREFAEIKAWLELGKRADRYLLKDRILQACQHWQAEGWCPPNSRETLVDMLEVYRDEGGNSFVHGMVDDTLRLPSVKGGRLRE